MQNRYRSAPAELVTLDAFEGDEYQRITVTVDTNGAPVEAATYLYLPAHKPVPTA